MTILKHVDFTRSWKFACGERAKLRADEVSSMTTDGTTVRIVDTDGEVYLMPWSSGVARATEMKEPLTVLEKLHLIDATKPGSNVVIHGLGEQQTKGADVPPSDPPAAPAGARASRTKSAKPA